MRIVALAGGVGGAKLADGLAQLEPLRDNLTVIVNTGDDFQHYGLRICPDIDTVCYTLANLANPQTGWGRKDETWSVFEDLRALGGPEWFRLGDRDLSTHLERTRRLMKGDALSLITRDFCRMWGIGCDVIPMSDERVSTWVNTKEEGWLPFQEYFVLHACRPRVLGFEFRGIESALPAPGVLEAIGAADGIIICPSNPFVSIAPILSIPGIGEAIMKKVNVVAVSPLVGGKALKGPAAKMFEEQGKSPSCSSVADFYQPWIRGIVIDQVDWGEADTIRSKGLSVFIEQTVMSDRPGRVQLAQRVLENLLAIREENKQ